MLASGHCVSIKHDSVKIKGIVSNLRTHWWCWAFKYRASLQKYQSQTFMIVGLSVKTGGNDVMLVWSELIMLAQVMYLIFKCFVRQLHVQGPEKHGINMGANIESSHFVLKKPLYKSCQMEKLRKDTNIPDMDNNTSQPTLDFDSLVRN